MKHLKSNESVNSNNFVDLDNWIQINTIDVVVYGSKVYHDYAWLEWNVCQFNSKHGMIQVVSNNLKIISFELLTSQQQPAVAC